MDLHDFLQRNRGYPDTQTLWVALKALVAANLDQLPLPGSGLTLERFGQLAQVAGHDLGLCKLFEGHTDALVILKELHSALPPLGSTWGMWAAEPPNARVHNRTHRWSPDVERSQSLVFGSRSGQPWLTAWDEQDRQQLVAVDMHKSGVEVTHDGWKAVVMAATGSVEVLFDSATGVAVGGPGDYLARPGFWRGGIGIAACWYGAAQRLAEALHEHCGQRRTSRPGTFRRHRQCLGGAACVLRACAAQIDEQPEACARLMAQQARACIEEAVEQVMKHVGRALGAGPYCKDPHFAQLMADLPVYLRQSHAERALAALGQLVADQPAGRWQL